MRNTKSVLSTLIQWNYALQNKRNKIFVFNVTKQTRRKDLSSGEKKIN